MYLEYTSSAVSLRDNLFVLTDLFICGIVSLITELSCLRGELLLALVTSGSVIFYRKYFFNHKKHYVFLHNALIIKFGYKNSTLECYFKGAVIFRLFQIVRVHKDNRYQFHLLFYTNRFQPKSHHRFYL